MDRNNTALPVNKGITMDRNDTVLPVGVFLNTFDIAFYLDNLISKHLLKKNFVPGDEFDEFIYLTKTEALGEGFPEGLLDCIGDENGIAINYYTLDKTGIAFQAGDQGNVIRAVIFEDIEGESLEHHKISESFITSMNALKTYSKTKEGEASEERVGSVSQIFYR